MRWYTILPPDQEDRHASLLGSHQRTKTLRRNFRNRHGKSGPVR